MTRRTISIPALIDAEFLTKMAARGLRSPSEYLAFLVRQDVPPCHHPQPSGLAELQSRVDALESQQHRLMRAFEASQHLRKETVSRTVDEGHALTRLWLASLRRGQEGVDVFDPLPDP